MTLNTLDISAASPIDTLLAGYAAGTLNPPLHALVGSHLSMTDQSRRYVAALEAMAGHELDGMAPAPFAGRDAMLSAILAQEPLFDDRDATARGADDPLFPAPLRHLIGRSSSEISWRFKLPGIKEYRISDSDAGEAVLYWVKAGRRLPQHTHEGEEVTLLLKGGFTDPLGHYRRGDIAVADADLDHTPVADRDEDCICFAVTDAPLQLTGPVIRLLRKVFHH